MHRFLLILLICFPLFLSAQNKKFTISGTVFDGASREQMIGAAVVNTRTGAGLTTNTFGFYSLTLPSDTVRILVSFVGYGKFDTTFVLKSDVRLDVYLPETVELAEVVVSAEKTLKIEEKVQMSQVTVPIEQIKHIPALFGEVDVLKVLQLLPGVQSGGEGQSGLYVRGGSPDQNLILLDGVPVYNVSHLLGFFSVFNADALKSVTLTKGGFPARYGGRLSSILEINMKEGHMREWHGVASIGAISSKLTVEGPIIKDKVSILVSGRRTYIDAVAKPLVKLSLRQNGLDGGLKLYFYDLNSKVNWRINDKHRVYLSGYFGRDVFAIQTEENDGGYQFNQNSGTDWGNETFAARWNWLINKKTFSNLTLTRSRFNFNFDVGLEEGLQPDVTNFQALYRSGIVDYGLRWDVDWAPNPNHYVKTGVGITQHNYTPGAFQLKLDSGDEFDLDTLLGNDRTLAYESFIFIEDEITIGSLKANIGLHASGFKVDSVFYPSLQPRIGLNYLVTKQWALKGSFATMTQFINLLTNESLSLPTDLWVPSTARIKPQQSWQAAVGVARTFGEDYEFSVEGFYKNMKNVVSYREGTTFLVLDNDWQSRVTQGKGWVYGAEVFLQKKTGKTTGWIGYTWARNWRQFDDINGGFKFPFKYDRRHDFKVVVSHRISPKVIITGTWIYGTGNAITLGTYKYSLPGIDVGSSTSSQFYFSDISVPGRRNAQRMPSYHRADIGIEFSKKKKRYERKWILGAYNLYARANPYYVYQKTNYNQNTGATSTSFRQIALFPLIPSIAYEVKF